MSKEIIGKIESMSMAGKGVSPKGAWERWEFIIDGNKYSCFDKEIYTKFRPPQIVKITGEDKEKNGKVYFNMSKMELVEEPVNQDSVPKKEDYSPMPETDKGTGQAQLHLRTLAIASKFALSFEDLFIKEKKVFNYIKD